MEPNHVLDFQRQRGSGGSVIDRTGITAATIQEEIVGCSSGLGAECWVQKASGCGGQAGRDGKSAAVVDKLAEMRKTVGCS